MNAMLEKVKNQENIIMLFFIMMLVGMGAYVIIDKNIIDVIYFGVIIYYFVKFLVIRKNGK